MNLEPIRAGLKSLRSLCDQYGQEPDGNSGDYDTGIQHGQNECAANIYKVLGEMEPALSQLLEAVTRVIEYESKLRESSQAMLKLGDTYGSGLQSGLADSLHALIHPGDAK